MNTKRTNKQCRNISIDRYTEICGNKYTIMMNDYIDDLIHERVDMIMDNLTISFNLEWKDGAEELVSKLKECEDKEDVIDTIKDNMIIIFNHSQKNKG